MATADIMHIRACGKIVCMNVVLCRHHFGLGLEQRRRNKKPTLIRRPNPLSANLTRLNGKREAAFFPQLCISLTICDRSPVAVLHELAIHKRN